MLMKKLRKGEARFIAKLWSSKSKTVFGVYDRAVASWPIHTPELGTVLQEVSKEEAETEATRLNALVGITVSETPAAASKAAKKAEAPKKAEKPSEGTSEASGGIVFTATAIPEIEEIEETKEYEISELGPSVEAVEAAYENYL